MDFADRETAPTISPFTKFEIMGEPEMLWARLLAYVTGTVNQELLLRNEYLATENRILRGQIKGGLLLSEGEKATLAEIGHRMGQRALEDVAATAKPDTILGWDRKLVANKSDVSKFRRSVGRPKLDEETERLVVQMARENPSWGYDPVWRTVAAASVATIYGTLPRGAQPSGQRQSDFVSFAAGGKGEHGSRAVSRTTGRPAEVLREGSGIRVDGTDG